MRFAPLALAATVFASLTLVSCASTPTADGSCVPALKDGSITASTVVNDEFGTVPVVTLPESTATDGSQRRLVSHQGSDTRTAQPGDLVSINFVVLNGSNGDSLQSTDFDAHKGAAPVLLTEDFAFPALYQSLQCAVAGDRLLVAVAPKDGLGDALTTDWGLPADTTLLMVIDVVAVGPARATGPELQLPNGFPNVVTTENGTVGIVLPPSTPSTELRVAQRIKGSGPKVQADDVVIGQVLTVDWQTRSVLSSTWQQGTPTSFGTEAQGTELRTLLTGYSVGSQIVALVPSQSGTTVSVVDIIGIG